MESVLRAAVIYSFLLVVFRVAGRRTLAQLTNFDFVLLLMMGDAMQQALLRDDYSITNAVLVILTLILLDISISLAKDWSPRLALWVEGLPIILVEDGKPLWERMHKARVGREDVLEAARDLQGLERMEDIRYAVLERNGEISIIPKKSPE